MARRVSVLVLLLALSESVLARPFGDCVYKLGRLSGVGVRRVGQIAFPRGHRVTRSLLVATALLANAARPVVNDSVDSYRAAREWQHWLEADAGRSMNRTQVARLLMDAGPVLRMYDDDAAKSASFMYLEELRARGGRWSEAEYDRFFALEQAARRASNSAGYMRYFFRAVQTHEWKTAGEIFISSRRAEVSADGVKEMYDESWRRAAASWVLRLPGEPISGEQLRNFIKVHVDTARATREVLADSAARFRKLEAVEPGKRPSGIPNTLEAFERWLIDGPNFGATWNEADRQASRFEAAVDFIKDLP